MTRTTNARIAGVTFLIYVAAGIASLVLAGHAQATDLLSLLTSFSALVLGVMLYAITREQDPDLAMLGLLAVLGLTYRVVEAGEHAGAIFFAVGSTVFSWLLLRGRMIPVTLAWLGIVASVFLVVILLAQRAGLLPGERWYTSVTWLMWFPMLVFEVTLSVWLIVKGVAAPAREQLA